MRSWALWTLPYKLLLSDPSQSRALRAWPQQSLAAGCIDEHLEWDGDITRIFVEAHPGHGTPTAFCSVAGTQLPKSTYRPILPIRAGCVKPPPNQQT
ncbi:hypothetical protein B0J13DRAFT_546007 [Dactylonectria estremocensis]|uniref:Uncharacterized protein n=1 Tax=Dactylonectria estremocensis TaxID=1079267 RepID=A0A9P9J7U4_9HYPO|nr:hypothetical protein B0J13DRAFT_546007 [Dactylonectria estremocensis]